MKSIDRIHIEHVKGIEELPNYITEDLLSGHVGAQVPKFIANFIKEVHSAKCRKI